LYFGESWSSFRDTYLGDPAAAAGATKRRFEITAATATAIRARAREISQECAAREGPEGRRFAFGGGPAVDDCDEQQNVDRNYAVINLETRTRARARADTQSYAHTGRPPAGFTGGWGFLYLAVGTVRRLHVYTHRLAALYACLR